MADKDKIRRQTAARVRRNRTKTKAEGYERHEFNLSDREYEAVVTFITKLRSKDGDQTES